MFRLVQHDMLAKIAATFEIKLKGSIYQCVCQDSTRGIAQREGATRPWCPLQMKIQCEKRLHDGSAVAQFV